MRNAKIAKHPFIILLFLTLLLSSCSERGQPESGDQDTGKISKPDGIITPREARNAYVRYENRRIPLIQKYEDSIDRQGKDYEMRRSMEQNEAKSDTAKQKPQQFEAARFIHFKYDSIKKYMAYIEREAELSGEKIESLRVYFSNNPEKEEYSKGIKVVHPRQNSVMLSPTIKRNDQEFIFFTADENDGKRRAITLTDDFLEIKKGTNTFESLNGSKSKASIIPSLFSPPVNSPSPFFAANSTTYNRGNGSPPNTQ